MTVCNKPLAQYVDYNSHMPEQQVGNKVIHHRAGKDNAMNANRLHSGRGQNAGKRIGNYRIIELLGKGGFASVYLCEHRYIGTLAAVKVLRAGMDEIEESNFHAEACIAASLVHPHIIRVLEFGVEGHRPYLVMDYAPNGTMRQLYPRGSRMLVKYVDQIAE